MLLKTRLHQHLFQFIETRISELFEQRTQISHESTDTGKGSAGDKHEVGIAMAQLEIEKIDTQIALLQQQLLQLKKTDPQQTLEHIQLGALFSSSSQWFYCCVPLGAISFEEHSVFCLSPEAPLFQALKGKKAGESAVLNGKNWILDKVL